MDKKKNKLLVLALSASLAATYLSYEHVYTPTYEVLTHDKAYASYSKGKVYIGNAKFLEKLTGVSDDDILVLDERDDDDPNFKIYNSCRITNKDERNEILEILCQYEKDYPSNWNRTIESLRLEWFAHNFFYFFDYQTHRTTDVDLNNGDEKIYDNSLLRRILKL